MANFKFWIVFTAGLLLMLAIVRVKAEEEEVELHTFAHNEGEDDCGWAKRRFGNYQVLTGNLDPELFDES